MQTTKDAENLTANENQSPNMEEKFDVSKKLEEVDQTEKVVEEKKESKP